MRIWMPMMPLNQVLFPGMPMPLAILEDRYVRMIRECLEKEQPFGVALIRYGREVGGLALPHEVGTTAQIVQAQELEHGYQIVVVGQDRFRIRGLAAEGDLLRAEVCILESDPEADRASVELCTELAEMLREHVRTVLDLLGMPFGELEVPREPERLSFMIAAHLTTSLRERQELLELDSTAERLLRERDLLRAETEQYRLLLTARERARRVQLLDDDNAGLAVLSRN